MVGVLLGDTLTLLGDAHLALDRTLRERIDEAVGRTGAAGDGAATAVEEDDAHAMLLADGSEVLLGAVEIPERGQDAAILIGVGITDHHLLGETVGDTSVATGLQRTLGHRMGQERVHDARAALKVANRLEERDDRQKAVGVFRTTRSQSGFTGQEVDGEQVGDRAGHADDQRT